MVRHQLVECVACLVHDRVLEALVNSHLQDRNLMPYEASHCALL